MTQDSTMLFNPSTTPVVYDHDGRIVAGGERVPVDKVSKVAQEAINGGLLVLEEPESRNESSDEEEPTGKDESSAKAKDPAPTAKAPGASAPKKAP